MLVYLVRHGDAENTVDSDYTRKLTEKGRTVTAQMAKLAAKIRLGEPELVIASPLVRAQETAAIVREHFGQAAKMETSDALRPEADIERAMQLIASQNKDYSSIMLVSHDPLLSMLASAIISGGPQIVIEMQKSTVVAFEITRFEVPRMRGALRLYLPPDAAVLAT